MPTDEPRLDRHDEGMRTGDGKGFSGFVRRAASAIAMVVLVVGLILISWRALPILLAIFLGILFAVFLRGPTNRLAAHTRLNHGLSMALVCAVLLVVVLGGGWLLAPTVSEQAEQIAATIPQSIEQVRNWVQGTDWGARMMAEAPSLTEIGEGIGWQNIGGVFTSAAGAITHLFFVLFVGLYLAINPATYKRGIVRLVPINYRSRAEEVLDVVSHQLGWWLIGQMGSMLTVGVLSTIGLWLLGIPLALVLGLVSGLFSFVPILGPLAAFVPAGLVALLVSPMHVVYVAALYLGVQAIEGYFVTPMIQKKAVSLPPALVIITQILAGVLLGLIGVIVATPLVVMLMAIINMVYIEDVLGDETQFSDKIPGEERQSRRENEAEPHIPPGAEPA